MKTINAIAGMLIGCIFFAMITTENNCSFQSKNAAVLFSTPVIMIQEEAVMGNVDMSKDQKIKRENLIGYTSTDQSIKDGYSILVKTVNNKGSCKLIDTG